MQASDPVWYEALQGNPVEVPTFTNDLKARIKAEALSSTVQRRSSLRRFVLIGISAISILGFFLLTTHLSIPGISNLGQEQSAQSLLDSGWQEMIDAQYVGSHNEILHMQNFGDDRKVIFTKKLFEHKGFQSISLAIDSFEWKSKQWKWRMNAATSIGDPQREVYKEQLITSWSGLEQLNIFHGVVINQSISQIEVLDDQNLTQSAIMFRHSDGNTYWFIALPHQGPGYKDGYTVKGLDMDGNVLTSQTYYAH